MRSLTWACLVLIFMLSGCALQPLPEPAPTQELAPAPSPTNTEVPLPDAKSEPLAALRYSSSPEIVQTATFTVTVTQKPEPVSDASGSATGTPSATAEASTGTEESPGSILNITVSSWGAARLSEPGALEAKQQWLVGPDPVELDVVVADDYLWRRFQSDDWHKEGPLGQVDTQALFATQVLAEIRALLAAPAEADTAEWVEDTTIGGEPVHHLRFVPRVDELDPCLLSAVLLISPEPLTCDRGTASASGEVWLSAKDLTPRQLSLHVSQQTIWLRQKLIFDYMLWLDDINLPVEIEPPQAATPVTTPVSTE